MGKKYIIELEDKPFNKGNGDFLYRVKGFNSLVFDMTGVGKLTPYINPDLEQVRKEAYQRGYCDALEKHCEICEEKHDAEEAYQQGLNDLWEATQKAIKMYCEIDNEVFLRVFYDVKCDWGESVLQALFKNTPQHLIDSIRKYEQEQEKIHVGDEVTAAFGKAVVMGVGPVYLEYVYANGHIGSDKVKNVKKTGRHFPEIAEVLKKMKEGQE